MAILRADDTYVYLKDAHARMYGYERPEELLGRSWRLLYDADEARRGAGGSPPSPWRGAREGGGAPRDGSSFPQERSLAAIAGGGLACVVRDISEAKHAEKLQRALYRIA